MVGDSAQRTRSTALKVLVTGGAGLVAGHLVRSAPASHDVEVTWHVRPAPPGVPGHRVDLTDRGATTRLIATSAPDVVVHTAYSMTDRAAIVDATANVASACAAGGVELVHLSTDAVFGGDRPPYVETDRPDPVNDYGRWKAEAESAAVAVVPDVCITRTSLVVSLEPPDPATAWLLDAIERGERPTLFTDEWRTPIRADDLAAAIWELVGLDRTERSGIWHLPGPEVLSRWQIGERIIAGSGLGDSVELARQGSIADHPTPRSADLTLRSIRPPSGTGLGPVP